MRASSMLALLLASCAGDVDRVPSSVVYGEDGRTEVYAHPSAVHRAIAESAIAMQVHQSWIDQRNSSDVRITYRGTLGDDHDLCAGEPFADQPDPGSCSGTLIDDRHLLTAGHCVVTATDCAEWAWVFGYRYVSAGVLATLTSDDVYRCQETFAYADELIVDHVIVRFDRPVVGHAPAPIRREPAGLPLGEPLVLIGHPNGIPMKIDSGGVVTSSSDDSRWLLGTVDAFEGNSGSGVFDQDGNLVAVLFSGATDYIDAGGCNVVNVIDPPPEEDGEALTYAHTALDAFCASTGASATLCPSAPPGDDCAHAEHITPRTQTITATLDGYSALTSGSCGGAGAERSYAFWLGETTRMRAESDGVLYLRRGCEGAEVACDAQLDEVLEPGPYVLFVDSTTELAIDLTFERVNAPADGGIDGGAPPGCGCRASSASVGPSWLALVLLALWRRARR